MLSLLLLFVLAIWQRRVVIECWVWGEKSSIFSFIFALLTRGGGNSHEMLIRKLCARCKVFVFARACPSVDARKRRNARKLNGVILCCCCFSASFIHKCIHTVTIIFDVSFSNKLDFLFLYFCVKVSSARAKKIPWEVQRVYLDGWQSTTVNCFCVGYSQFMKKFTWVRCCRI